MSVMTPVLRKTFKQYADKAYAAITGDQWTTRDYFGRIKAAMVAGGVDFQPLLDELLMHYAEQDLKERGGVDPLLCDDDGHLQPSLFERELFDQGVIRLGDGTRVKMREAKARHWIAHKINQEKAILDIQQRNYKTTQYLVSGPGAYQLENPNATTDDAMVHLGLWPQPPATPRAEQ